MSPAEPTDPLVTAAETGVGERTRSAAAGQEGTGALALAAGAGAHDEART